MPCYAPTLVDWLHHASGVCKAHRAAQCLFQTMSRRAHDEAAFGMNYQVLFIPMLDLVADLNVWNVRGGSWPLLLGRCISEWKQFQTLNTPGMSSYGPTHHVGKSDRSAHDFGSGGHAAIRLSFSSRAPGTFPLVDDRHEFVVFTVKRRFAGHAKACPGLALPNGLVCRLLTSKINGSPTKYLEHCISVTTWTIASKIAPMDSDKLSLLT